MNPFLQCARRAAPRWVLVLALGTSLVGCARAAHPKQVAMPSAVSLDDGYTDFEGVLHVHTNVSYDAHGRFEDAVRIANAQGLDFVVITDHDSLQALHEGKQGWHGATLVLIGMEISLPTGHYLALNVTQDINPKSMTMQQVIDEVTRQGGFGFIAHPHFKKHPWKEWNVKGFTGVELFNAARDVFDEHFSQLVLWTLSQAPDSTYLSILKRPYYPIRTWDALIERHGRVVGIGSTDAHEFELFGLTFAPYELMFQLCRTYALLPSSTLTADGLYDALRKGHAYVGVPLVANPAGFSFMANDGSHVLGIMGDEVALAPGLRLSAKLPQTAELSLLKDGELIISTTADSWDVPITEPGVYRLEASREGKPWIFSNPIYVGHAVPSPVP